MRFIKSKDGNPVSSRISIIRFNYSLNLFHKYQYLIHLMVFVFLY